MKNGPYPCEGCPHANKQGLNAQTGRNELDFALEQDGSLVYAQITACGAAFGRVDASRIANAYPEISEGIRKCSNPSTQEATISRKGFLGKLGFSRTVLITECGAASQEQLSQIAISNGME